LSSHKLEVERGRHIGVEHNNRICKQCNSNNVENETHFLWVCECYNHERESHYNKITTTVSLMHVPVILQKRGVNCILFGEGREARRRV
jgi:ribosomal protein L37AE/L43A